LSSFLLVSVFVVSFSLSFVAAEEWDDNNDPRLFSRRYTYLLSGLPLSGRTPIQPWSDTYWPSYQSGMKRAEFTCRISLFSNILFFAIICCFFKL
jgi:hypothetical protein